MGDALAYEFYVGSNQPNDRLTYRELRHKSLAIAYHLKTRNLRGARVLLIYPGGLEFIAAFLGCLSAGAVAVPIYPPRRNQKLSRLERIVEDCTPQAVLTTGKLEGKVTSYLSSQIPENNCLITDNIEGKDFDDQGKGIVPESIAFLQYTSGSTGKPKGVVITHENIISNSKLIYRLFGHSANSQGVSWLPFYHDMGLIGGVLQPLFGGFPVSLMAPQDFLKKPLLWLKTISKLRGTTSGAPNFAYELCIDKISSEDKQKLDLSSWNLAFIGAEPVRKETLDKFADAFAECGFKKSAFYPCYGMAEATLMVCGGNKQQEPVIKGNGDRNFVSCGKLNSGQEIIIVDQDQLPNSEGEVGEVWIKANQSIAAGYWNNQELTKSVFRAKISGSNEPYLRTGDLGFIQGGELYITGRIKDVIIIRGQNYYPQDIEQTVERSHRALRANSGAAFSVEIGGEERLIIIQEVERTFVRKLGITQQSQSDLDKEELRAEIENAIRAAIVREFGIRVDDIQLIKTGSIFKTSSGKIQRYLCKEKYLNEVSRKQKPENKRSPQMDYRPSTSSTKDRNQLIQDWLSRWLSNKLQIPLEKIDRAQAFVEYGVDSVMAVELAQDLSEWLPDDLEIEPTLAWNFPNIEGLARYLAEENVPPESGEEKNQEQEDLETFSEDELVRSLMAEIAWAKERDS